MLLNFQVKFLQPAIGKLAYFTSHRFVIASGVQQFRGKALKSYSYM